uniref:Uncharacterized protein n=1 Tax=Schistosoma curassoni TaxID=6186 RepID=A0A183KWW4_9TREM
MITIASQTPVTLVVHELFELNLELKLFVMNEHVRVIHSLCLLG